MTLSVVCSLSAFSFKRWDPRESLSQDISLVDETHSLKIGDAKEGKSALSYAGQDVDDALVKEKETHKQAAGES